MSMKAVALMALGLALLASPSLGPKRPALVWNASASVPIGLYFAASPALHIGDYVLVRPTSSMQVLAEGRGYIGAGVPLLKRVAAIAGDRVCRRGRVVWIAGRRAFIALASDTEGRRLPVWKGCHQLRDGQVFVLGAHPASFDSRYFGPLHTSQVVGTAIPIWLVR